MGRLGFHGYHGSMERPALPMLDLERPGPRDRLGRPIHDLRISVTDRCNFRCVYCMPKEVFGRDFAFLPRELVLTFEEIERLARVFVELGAAKLRITGGEPLVRRDLPKLIERLATIRTPDGAAVDLTLTTNGSALRALAGDLAAAGLGRITVSLDSLDDATFRSMNDVDFPVDKVLDGIDAARAAGLAPLKINMVVRRGLNETSVVPMARWARSEGLILRFIEYMDVGHTNGWRMDDVVPAAEILVAIGEAMPLEPVPPSYPGEVADRYRYLDGAGEVGRHRVGDAAVLRHLHAGAAVRGRAALHVPVRDRGPRPARAPADRRLRRRRARRDRCDLGGPSRPLQRAPVRCDRGASPSGDVRARRVVGARGSQGHLRLPGT